MSNPDIVEECGNELRASELREYKRANNWITEMAWKGIGVVEIGITDNGNIGVWLPSDDPNEEQKAVGIGYDVVDAILNAIRSEGKKRL